ncbi:MAG: excinuclease ABC subunit UvrA [Desulfovibrionaceae bacterium]|nr:excinuclease ABC subunit UvrA [Desulfovibrionaceae bacterium]
MHDCITIQGARHHNLKNISLKIPHARFTVICGPSGSGKSTLAFDLIYAEGQRRYVESLSAYARQFLPQLDKPDADSIEGLSPAISLEQQTSGRNPRSTVGTVTEIYDFLRVFYASLGTPYCPQCGKPVTAQSLDEIIAELLILPEKTRLLILAPLVRLQKGTQADLLKKLKAEGFVRIRLDGQILALDAMDLPDKNKKHTLDLVIDRLVIKQGIRSRLAESAELALTRGKGSMLTLNPDTGEEHIYSTERVCPVCHVSMPNLSPQLFSFNAPQGACPKCSGLGTIEYLDPDLIAPNRGLSLASKAILPWSNPQVFAKYAPALSALGTRENFTLQTPLKDFSAEALHSLFHGEQASVPHPVPNPVRTRWGFRDIPPGTEYWPGIIPLLEKGMQYGDMWRDILSRYLQTTDCPKCHGSRLRPEALSVRIGNLNIHDFCSLPIDEALRTLHHFQFSGRQESIADPILSELHRRLCFLSDVGLDYLTLHRTVSTLSGGESQRIRLASQLGSGLTGVTYVLDEPSIGLHPRDNLRLIQTLRNLQQKGNTVLVVEHDEAMIRSADHIVELGPGSGYLGGEIVFQGSFPDLLQHPTSLTARYLRGELTIPIPKIRRTPSGMLTIRGASANNLKHIDCSFPLGTLTCVTGVSGSGKSSLVIDTLCRHLTLAQGQKADHPGSLNGIEGTEQISRITTIDQTPIGRTPRSNPATYTKIFDEIRKIFSLSPDAMQKGYTPGRFSFNVAGGRCETCSGDGQICVAMHFLPDVYVTCDVCGGLRYNKETLDVRYRGKNIAEVLDMPISEARVFFANHPSLERKLAILEKVGLGYLRIGQAATTLSGGEAQRIKLSRELGKKSLPGAMYVLDEPTTGLHVHETGLLISLLHELVDKGATVIVIEHNPDVIMAADHVIDLGPGGGCNGGRIIASGTPEEIIRNPNSITGSCLKEWLEKSKKKIS